MKILAIDSSYDEITQASYVYRNRHVYPYLESKGFEVVRCQGKSARRVYVQPEACRDDIVYMTGVGHGVYTTYMGEYCNPIFDIGKYQAKELNNKVAHFFPVKPLLNSGQTLSIMDALPTLDTMKTSLYLCIFPMLFLIVILKLIGRLLTV